MHVFTKCNLGTSTLLSLYEWNPKKMTWKDFCSFWSSWNRLMSDYKFGSDLLLLRHKFEHQYSIVYWDGLTFYLQVAAIRLLTVCATKHTIYKNIFLLFLLTWTIIMDRLNFANCILLYILYTLNLLHFEWMDSVCHTPDY